IEDSQQGDKLVNKTGVEPEFQISLPFAPIERSAPAPSPWQTGFCRARGGGWGWGWRWADRCRLRGQTTHLEMEGSADTQDCHGENNPPAERGSLRNRPPKLCRRPRRRDCAGVEKHAPEVEPSA